MSEANSCYEIVRHLKRHQHPYKLPGAGPGGMLKVPSVFDIDVYIQGKEAKYYQRYFTAAMTHLSVKQNSNGTHFTLPGGEPVISGITVGFKEITVRTSNDFEDGL